MATQIEQIFLGTAPNDKSGTLLRDGGEIINSNDTKLFNLSNKIDIDKVGVFKYPGNGDITIEIQQNDFIQGIIEDGSNKYFIIAQYNTGDISDFGTYAGGFNDGSYKTYEILSETQLKTFTGALKVGTVAALSTVENVLTIGTDGVIKNISFADLKTQLGFDNFLTSVVQDLNPSLGGNLDLNGKDISGQGNIDINGNITGNDLTAKQDVTFENYKQDRVDADAVNFLHTDVDGNLQSSPVSSIGGGGSQNIQGGDFTGVFDVSEGKNVFYNDYVDGSVLILSLSSLKDFGSLCTVRIKGGLLSSIPNGWSFSGDNLSLEPSILNELTFMFVNDDDIRIVNRAVGYSAGYILDGYTETYFNIQSQDNIVQNNGITSPIEYNGTGYSNVGLSDDYLPSGVDGGLLFKVTDLTAANVTIAFQDVNNLILFAEFNVACLITSGSIYALELGNSTEIVSVNLDEYYRIYRNGSAFELQRSTDGGNSFSTIHTYAYSNSSNMYISVAVNSTLANAPCEMSYIQSIGTL